jgi:hypothetical protein
MPSLGGGIHCWRMPEVLRRYNSLLWINYPLALCARRRILVSLSGIIPSRRYFAIGFHQSSSRHAGPTTTTNTFA